MPRSRTLVLIGGAALVLSALIYRATRRAPSTDREQLEALIEQATSAAEAGRLKQLKALIAPNYRDAAGRDQRELKQLLTVVFIRHRRRAVYLISRQITVDPQLRTATIALTLVVTRGPRVERLSDIVRDGANGLALSLKLQKRDQRWLVDAASWRGLHDLNALIN
ncbi:MAG: hypothetical protein H6707_16635 [Deltaproteobacteria bacterium]|nr:hypothetical protein [Deltaproteobacteria bacterium]